MSNYKYDEMIKVKRHGKLLAIDTVCGWQYWEYDGALYSINSDGNPERMSIWCSMSRLDGHLHQLWQICGKKKFTECDDMVIVDKERISQFSWA